MPLTGLSFSCSVYESLLKLAGDAQRLGPVTHVRFINVWLPEQNVFDVGEIAFPGCDGFQRYEILSADKPGFPSCHDMRLTPSHYRSLIVALCEGHIDVDTLALDE